MKVLLTGATGTFGKMFLNEVLTKGWGVNRVGALARSESRLYLQTEQWKHAAAYRPFLGDVRDEVRMRDACRGMDAVVHAAALKRVETGAYNADEMKKTNVDGTEAVCRAAMLEGVQKVLVVSSDKAVEPTTYYGGTKFLAEQAAMQFNTHSQPQGTAIAAVRYGNVLGSTGSVLHVWKQQMDAKQPIGITHLDMTRFVITIREAVRFALRSLHAMHPGEIFVPDMQACTMKQLADAYATDHPYEVIGLRPGGEKMHEVLLFQDEHRRLHHAEGGYVVEPDVDAEWSYHTEPHEGARVDWVEGERYSSDNPRFHTLTVPQLREKIVTAFAEGV